MTPPNTSDVRRSGGLGGYTVLARTVETAHAICDDDSCPWKKRTASIDDLHVAAEKHTKGTGHPVSIYEQAHTYLKAAR